MPLDLVGKWYTDYVDVFRNVEVLNGSITEFRRFKVHGKIPCRVFRSSRKRPIMEDTAAQIISGDALACAPEIDIQTGDELMVTRGGRIGYNTNPDRYFAGQPTKYYEPFGGVMPNLDHQEIPLLTEERIK